MFEKTNCSLYEIVPLTIEQVQSRGLVPKILCAMKLYSHLNKRFGTISLEQAMRFSCFRKLFYRLLLKLLFFETCTRWYRPIGKYGHLIYVCFVSFRKWWSLFKCSWCDFISNRHLMCGRLRFVYVHLAGFVICGCSNKLHKVLAPDTFNSHWNRHNLDENEEKKIHTYVRSPNQTQYKSLMLIMWNNLLVISNWKSR